MPPPPPTGRLIRTMPLHVEGFRSRHSLTIYLPPGYGQGDARYPVLYAFDGQNMFGHEGSYAGGWHMHEALDKRAARGKAVPIVVAIHHGGTSRNRELSPWTIGHGHARGEAFLAWAAGPLRALIRQEFRVLEGPEHTAICGSSLGGLMALYAVLRHPEVYGRALCLSPALWVGRGAIFGMLRHARLYHDPRIYIDCGGRESGGHAMHQAYQAAVILARRGLVVDTQLKWRPDKRGSHNERAWRRRLPKALDFVYGSRKASRRRAG